TVLERNAEDSAQQPRPRLAGLFIRSAGYHDGGDYGPPPRDDPTRHGRERNETWVPARGDGWRGAAAPASVCPTTERRADREQIGIDGQGPHRGRRFDRSAPDGPQPGRRSIRRVHGPAGCA